MHSEVNEVTALLSNQDTQDEGKRKQHSQNTRRRSSSALVAYQPSFHEEPDTHTTSESETDQSSTVAIWLVIPTCLLGVFVANADGSLVVVSSQQIASEFNALFNAQWLLTSFGLAQCASQPLYGKLSDVFGRKANLVVAYLLFAAGCFICGIGQTFDQVLAGRAISGIGAAGMTALVSVIIADMVSVRNIAAYRSYVNVAATLGRALGGPVGGWLCDTIGWRWAFYGQVPLTVIGLIPILWKLPMPSKSDDTLPKQTFRDKLKRVDGIGALLLASAIIAFLLMLDFTAKELPLLWMIVPSIAFVVFSAGFWAVEKYWAKEPILPLRLLFNRAAMTSNLVAGFQIAAQFSMFYSAPLYYQIATDNSVTEAGLRLVPAVIGNATAGLLSGWVIAKYGRYKWLTLFASAFACLGYAMITIRWRGSANWPETLYIFCGGFGSGIIQSTSFVHLAASLQPEDIAIAGTTLYLCQNIFLLIGVQSATTLLHTQLRHNLDTRLEGVKGKEKIIELAISSVNAINTFPPWIKTIVTRAYIDGLTWTFASSLAYGFLGLLVALSIREEKLD